MTFKYSISQLRSFRHSTITNECPNLLFSYIPRRKRGKRGGIKNRIRRNIQKKCLPIPTITFGNVRSILRKIDELRGLCKYIYQYRESCCIAITESWLTENTPTSAVSIDNFECVRLDRNSDSNKSCGGGTLLYINKHWCSNYNIVNAVCTPDFECLTVNIRPFYLPREVSNIYISAVYIPPNGNFLSAAKRISDIIHDLSDRKPRAMNILLGDMNNCELKSFIPNFFQYVNCATRGQNILDKFFCNIKNCYMVEKLHPLRNSDHSMLYMKPTYQKKIRRIKIKPKKVNYLDKDSIENLRICFQETNWDIFKTAAGNVNEVSDVISCYIKFCTELHTKTKIVRKFPNNHPWISKDLMKLIREKHRLFGKEPREAYLEKCKEVNVAIKNAKISYKNSIEDKLKCQPKISWQGIKQISGQYCEKSKSKLLDESGYSDKLNLFYSRFDEHDYRKEQNDCRQRLLNLCHEVTEIKISKDEVMEALRKIKPNKASGADEVKGSVLKSCRNELSEILQHIFQISLSTGIFPDCWKVTKIIPVQKKENPKTENDFRPVALTSIIAKTLERIVLQKLLPQIKSQLDNHQFAYQEKRDTTDAVITLTHSIQQHLNKLSSNYARILFVDYSSAFNTIQSHILIEKLNTLNVSVILQKWILSFLTERPQFVKTDVEQSKSLTVNTGSPQGCVISPILFILYTNELKSQAEVKIIKYADDTAIIGLISNEDESEYRNRIRTVYEWCQLNQLKMNASKTKEVVIDFRRNKSAKAKKVTIGGEEIEVTKSYKYLGCLIDDELNWKLHVSAVIKKAHKRLFLLRQLKSVNICKSILKIIFTSYIGSTMSYCSICWYPSTGKEEKRKLASIEKRALKIALCKENRNVTLEETTLSRSRVWLKTTMRDQAHPMNPEFKLLRGGNLSVPVCRTSRYLQSPIPQMIIQYNNSKTRLFRNV